MAAGTAWGCGWVGRCLGRLGGTGRPAWRAGPGARRLCGCLTAVWGARLVVVLVREWVLGCLLLCPAVSRGAA